MLVAGMMRRPSIDAENATTDSAPLLPQRRPSSDPEPPPQQRDDDRIDWLATGLCFIFPAIGGLLFGYDIGATSGVLVSLTSEKLSGTDWYSLTSFQSGLVVSMSLFGALIGSLVTLAAGNQLGRRTELITAASLYGERGLARVRSASRIIFNAIIASCVLHLPMIADHSTPFMRGGLHTVECYDEQQVA